MKFTHTLFAALLFGLAGTVSAQWIWLDKDGRKVFSDRAPGADISEKSILKRPGAQALQASAPTPAASASPDSPAKASDAKPGVDKNLEAKKKEAEDAKANARKAEEQRLAKIKADNCARAKQAKATFDSGVRVARTNTAGEREVLDDAARASELQHIQDVISSECQ